MIRNLLFILLLVCAFSCSSDDDSGTQPANGISDPGFYGLQVGNAWVYKSYQRNPSTETYDDTGVVDSISIVGTEVINGHTYFKFRRLTTGNASDAPLLSSNGEYFELVRDSLGNLIYDDGSIKFTHSDLSERTITIQSWGTIFETLTANEAQMTVEAGAFTCNYSERYAKSPEGEQFPGLDRYYYADGIGLIYDTTSFVSTSHHTVERRLDSYNVQ
ncbi:hypothetical protein [Bizionia sp. M204]|uniref:hypothetical protein n=1 Tax=Bizionia sp. M204 TaxID=2675331 RepID=UPI00206D844B|nr:hypothetical protein [Bizionia sp. M204]UPS91947.1 hypothetical protein GMA17_09560 [Bizionia sp. M204]